MITVISLLVLYYYIFFKNQIVINSCKYYPRKSDLMQALAFNIHLLVNTVPTQNPANWSFHLDGRTEKSK